MKFSIYTNWHKAYVKYKNWICCKNYFSSQKKKLQVKESVLKNDVQDFHWFQLQGVKALIAVHEPNSQETKNAEKVLNEAISSLVQSYNEIYNNKVPIQCT